MAVSEKWTPGDRGFPDFAALHPGYDFFTRQGATTVWKGRRTNSPSRGPASARA